MIQKETFQFLQELKKHNNRLWFHSHSEIYRAAKKNVQEYVLELVGAVVPFDDSVKDLTPREALFRLHRDARFSKGKPYKSHFGIVITKNGRKSTFAGYYFHLEPGASFVLGGSWRPESEDLTAIRQRIQSKPNELRKILKKASAQSLEGILGDSVKTAPRGFSKDDPNIDLIRFKDFLLRIDISDKDVLSSDSAQIIAKHMKAMKPFIDYLNAAMS